MSGQAPWSIKGIRAETREAARGLAQRDGLTIGEWMNRLIEDIGGTGSEADMPPAQPQQPSGMPAAMRRSSAASLQPFPTQDAGWQSPPSSDPGRLAVALEALTRRLEGLPTAAPQPAVRPANTGGALDRALGMIGERMEETERRHDRTFGHIDATLSEIRQTHAAIAERLRRLEDADPANKSLGALRALENALARVAQQVQVQDERATQFAAELSGMRQLDAEMALMSGRLQAHDHRTGTLEAELAAIRSGAGSEAELAARVEALEEGTGDIIRQTSESIGQVGATIEAVAGRLAELETGTASAVEEADRGLHMLSDRVAAAEELAQSASSRLAELMVDLSARMTEIESMAQQAGSKAAIAALEARLGEFQSGMADMDQRLSGQLAGVRTELLETMRDGIDSRFAEIAGTFAQRIDQVERRSTDALERVGGEVARVASALSQRLQRLEESDTRARETSTSSRMEMAGIARAIEERMGALEARDDAMVERAGVHMKQIADQLAARLEQSEKRTLDSVSEQMRTLADRLQARQEEQTRDLVKRIDDVDERGAKRIEDRLGFVAREIQAAEDRAKAVSAPLHRGFDTVIDRLDRLETRAIEPYAETVGMVGGGSVQIATPDDRYELGGTMSRDSGYRSDFETSAMPYADPDTDYGYGAAAPAPEPAPRRGGFASPFPVGEVGSGPIPASALDNPRSDDALGSPLTDTFDRQQADRDTLAHGLDGPPPEILFEQDDDFGILTTPTQQRRGGSDYLATARQAAIAAAQAREIDSRALKASAKSTRPGLRLGKGMPAPKAKPAASGSVKTKQGVSPVVLIAAAGIVATGGIYALNSMRAGASDEVPASLAPAETASVAPAATAVPETPALLPTVSDPAAAPATPDTATAPVADAAVAAATTGAAASPTAETGSAGAAAVPAPRRPTAMTDLARQQEVAAAEARRRAAELEARATARARQPSATPPAATSRPATAPTGAAASARPAAAAPASALPRAAASTPSAAYDEAMRRQQAGDATGALPLLQRAADAGDIRAQNRLARMYERGEAGVQRDMAAARRWTERAAASGSRRAQHNLGVYYAEGEGVQQDFGRAAENFRRAAQRGAADSQYNLGAMAEQGLGTERSDREAYYWYALAARSGDQDAARKAQEVGGRLDPTARQAEESRVQAFTPEAGGTE
jgi:localization factor PodJL